MLRGRRSILPLALAILSGWSSEARAYRPFDGTDAAVAKPDSLEIELGPVEYVREGSERTLVAPDLRLNYGIAEDWEAVLEGETTHGLSGGAHRTSLVGNSVSLKHVLRDGSLQDGSGPSLATEFALLLPGVNEESGVGGSLAGIVSQQWSWLTVHLNLAMAVTREQHGDVFLSAIIEGPHDWALRPVIEISYEQDFGQSTTRSALIGAIWHVRDDIAVDFGLRGARIDDRTVNEIRAGITFAIPGS